MKDGYYIHYKGKTQGPISLRRLQEVIGKVPTSASIRKNRSSVWVPVAEFIRAEGLQRFVEQTARTESQERQDSGVNPAYVVAGGVGLSLVMGLLIFLLWPSSEPEVVASTEAAQPVEQVVEPEPVQPARLVQQSPAPVESEPAEPTTVESEPVEPEPTEQMVAKPVGLHPPAETPPAQPATPPAKPDFRNVSWGMSAQEVKDQETDDVSNETHENNITYMFYTTKINGDVASLGYVFVDDKLVRAGYGIIARHSNNDAYISDFNSLNKTLVNKYGRATEDDVIGDDEYSLGRGNAVGMGHLTYHTKWMTDTTEITHILRGENLQFTHMVDYTSRELGHLEADRKDKQLMDKL